MFLWMLKNRDYHSQLPDPCSLLVAGRVSGQVRNSFQRWGQPGQQQGRRIPSLSSVRTRSMCCLLVSGLLTEMTQQIHSLRASGVISRHFARATGSEMRTFRKSAGTACTAPRETALLVMDFSLYPTGQCVWVQPEMEQRRSPLVSIPPFGQGCSRHELF